MKFKKLILCITSLLLLISFVLPTTNSYLTQKFDLLSYSAGTKVIVKASTIQRNAGGLFHRFKFTMRNGRLFRFGIPFNGQHDGRTYKNGYPTDGDYVIMNGAGFTREGGILLKNGKPFTGRHRGEDYVDGVRVSVVENKRIGK